MANKKSYVKTDNMPHVVLVGSLKSGFVAYGSFLTAIHADNWADERQLGDEAQIVPIRSPDCLVN